MPTDRADAPNVVWATNFQFDSTVDGKAVKIASMLDEHTRLSLTKQHGAVMIDPSHQAQLGVSN
ncbi:hypothetical protein [Rhodococcus erythropolis]|uniref:Putative transposase n=1 Tax=Rhodococcus erythropolis (strain PR4 / NBRC 100887) TaxID=234621 RepID=Q3L9I5_RHOE4|nr:hypothetical protein [Rhodococcus erythropolis]BAE46128.1 putative transposase [Rhodococcus erythropolis PR4]